MKEEMKKVIMTEDAKGSPNGIIVNEYKKGKKYIIPKSLSDVFIQIKVAVLDKLNEDVEEEKKEAKPVIEDVEPKMEEPKYENKMESVPKNKKKGK